MFDTIRDAFDEPDRAVSPVIGVILMVAITVILAAVIGTFVLDLGSDVNENPRAGVSFDQISGDQVDVTLTTLGNVQNATDIEVDGCGTATTFSNIGDTVSVQSCTPNDKINVIATLGGDESVISTYTVK